MRPDEARLRHPASSPSLFLLVLQARPPGPSSRGLLGRSFPREAYWSLRPMPPVYTATPRAQRSPAPRAPRTWSEASQSGSFAHDPVEAPAIRNAFQLVFAPSLELEPAAGDEILDGLRDEHRVLLPSPPARQCSTNEAVVPFNELLPSGLGDVHRLILGPQIPRATGPSSPVACSQP